ncbi:MAG: hypothetical protein N4A40_09880 [Tissierellales bacterium]|jgi:hypothetical protein|nr:hypothetical protein [Tissierellales bacterium]
MEETDIKASTFEEMKSFGMPEKEPTEEEKKKHLEDRRVFFESLKVIEPMDLEEYKEIENP